MEYWGAVVVKFDQSIAPLLHLSDS
jgi:hypothetical protein